MIFTRLRIENERDVRNRLGREVTLEEIYADADFSSIIDMPNAAIMQQEIKCEQRLWSPVYTTLQLIKKRRKRGDKIIFISDMYLPSSVIHAWLYQNSIFQEGDDIYISGEIGKTKNSGELYTHIAQLHNLKYSNWHHWGDNKISDYKQPKRLGIHPHLINIPYTPYEMYWRERLFCSKIQFNSICAGISRAINASYISSPSVDITTDIIAPLLCTYVYRVLKNAEKDQVKHLFFASRDAKILLDIAKVIHPYFPSIKNLQYFYVSRSALRESSSEDIISYFEQIGLANSQEKVGIIDTGSSGNQGCTFERINTILQSGGYNTAKGYFLHYQNAKDKSIYGEISEFPICYLSWLNPGDLQLLHSNVIEGFFTMTDDSSLKRYNKETLVFKDTDDLYYEDKSKLVNLHFDICIRWIQYAMDANLLPYLDNVFNNIAIPTLFDFWKRTPARYVKALVGYKIDNKPFVIEIRTKHLLKMVCGTKMAKWLIWKEGSMSLSIYGRILCKLRKIKNRHL